nr:type I polyketide synthase [Rhodoplanes tepidamans]
MQGVAVVGMAGRFPGCPDIAAFWSALVAGRMPLTRFTDDEMEERQAAEVLADPRFVRAAYVLDDIDRFDAAFFGIAPREAAALDPQHRLFLECAWAALEDAGHVPDKTAAVIGVYAGVNYNSYAPLLRRTMPVSRPEDYVDVVLTDDKDYVAGRTAHRLGLTGPALCVQTACSTSLAAVAVAARDLLAGGCDMALAGGAGVRAIQRSGYLRQHEGVLARDGVCRPFDAGASGLVDSSGVGVVVLRRLADAIADRDHVHAVITGIGMTNDGAVKASFIAPSVEGQARAIRAALDMAGVPAGSVGFVETHGTGTAIGDPIEIAALRRARGTTDPCRLGALKANFGHMGAAAGVAGLIKAALVVERGVVPPHPTFAAPSPECRLADGGFVIDTAPVAWRPDGPRRAGVSSFGIGGTNVHLVIEEAPSRELPSGSPDGVVVLPLSARTEAALAAARARLLDRLESADPPDLADVAHTLVHGRRDFERRLAAAGRTAAEAAASLRAAMPACAVSRRPVVFLFPGAGTPCRGRGAALYAAEPAFRAAVDRVAAAAVAHGAADPRDLLFARPDARGSDETTPDDPATPPADQMIALLALEIGLATALVEAGVEPAGMIGHSLGEYAAACLAGVFPVEAAVAIVLRRTALIEATAAGGMLLMPADARTADDLARAGLSVAAVNTPSLVMVSGPVDAVDALERALRAERRVVSRLPVTRAGHSALLDPVLPDFAGALAAHPLARPTRPFVSNLSGDWADPDLVATAGYWVRHLRETVRFSDGLDAAVQRLDAPVLVEVGPGQGLTALAKRHPAAKALQLVPLLRAAEASDGDDVAIGAALARLWTLGAADGAPARLAARRPGNRIPLPTYAFARERHWLPVASRQEGTHDGEAASAGAAGRPAAAPVDAWLAHPVWAQHPLPAWASLAGETHLLVGGGAFAAPLKARLEAAGAAVRAVDDADIDPAATLWCLWPLDTPPRSTHETALDHYRRVAAPAFDRLVALIGTHARLSAGRPPRLVLLVHGLGRIGGGEAMAPELAPLDGLLRTLPQEIPGAVCRTVDLDRLEVAVDAPEVADRLVRIVAAPPPETPLDQLFAVRNRAIWREELRASDTFLRRAPSPPDPAPLPLRERGRYLVLGGTGGIGTTLARVLAEASPGARLVLVGSAPPEPGSSRAAELQALRRELADRHGATVVLDHADLADPAALRAVVLRAVAALDGLDGVIHAAGVTGGGLVQAALPTGRDSNREIKVAAVLGLQDLLQDQLRDQPLDVLVLTSSLGSRFGAAGQADNVAANRFLDVYAGAGRLPRCARVITIAWDVWREVGLVRRLAQRHKELTGHDLDHGLRPDDGALWFRRLLADGRREAVVSTLPLDVLREAVRQTMGGAMARFAVAGAGAGTVPSGDAAVVPEAGDGEAPSGALERLIARLFADRLGRPSPGRDDSFLALGGDSLAALAVIAALRDSLGVEVSVRTLYETASPRRVAAHLRDTAADPARLESDAGLYLEVLDMSDEAVEQALADEPPARRAAVGSPAALEVGSCG